MEPLYANFDLTLTVRDTAGPLLCGIDYARDLFDAETMERLSRKWLTLLDGISSDPDLPLSRLSLDMPTDTRALAPLSSGQAGLWFLQRLAPESAVYNAVHAWSIEGALNLDALQRALQFVVNRHHALRTTFVLVDGRPRQRVIDPLAVDIPLRSLAGLGAESGDVEALRVATEAGREPFDLLQGPFFRVFALRLSEHRHWLVMVLHHAIRDGASTAILCGELSRAYNAFASGGAPELAPLRAQYADYAAWQHETLRGDRLEGLVTYWRERLAGAATLDLSTGRHPVLPSGAGARERFIVEAKLVAGLRALAQQEGASLHMTLLASFQVLLGRYANRDDVSIGVPVAARTRAEFEDVIGCFVNTVVHRGDLSGDPTFRTLLQHTRDSAAQAYAHQDLPFERLVETLAPERDPGRHPLFQAMFTLQDAFDSCPMPLALDGAAATPVDVYVGTTKIDLTLLLVRDASRLLGAIEYATDFFTASWARRLVGQFLVLLDAIVDDPDRPISRLPLVGAAERDRILVGCRNVGKPHSETETIPALFAAQVRERPDAMAVVDGERSVTYAQLDARARALARRLRDLGVAEGARVGVCAERSIEEIVAFVGALQAGCVYVPLDPSHPSERLAAILRDAGAAAIVVTPSARRALPEAGARPVIVLDSTSAAIDNASSAVETTSRAEDPAYILYTSATTGESKGVIVPQRAVARLVRDTDYLQLSAADAVAHLSNPAFDAAVFEIWSALLNGARLVVIPREAVLSRPALAADLERHGVTMFLLTTALFNLVARDMPQTFTDRVVFFGGETVEPRWVAAALAAGRPKRLLHVYGPTEATTFVTWQEVRSVDPEARTVPIGRPISSAEVYVLDRHREPVAPGVPGEIYIGGPGLAKGYLGRPYLTAEYFIAHPFAREPGARLYRTGDLARYDDAGVIEFLGRADRQVKIRGHRIEPTQVEAALRALPQIRDAVVAVRGDTSETRRLVAYVVVAAGNEPAQADVSRGLRRTLPDYMVPAAIVMLPAFPLTANGKIDRNALPDPDVLAARRTGAHAAPWDPLEHLIAQIWERLLGVRDVGVHDNFFDLGGHSLLAAQMVDEVARETGVNVPLTTLFTEATIAHLALALRGDAAAAAPVVAVRAEGTRPPLFFLHGDFSGGGFYCRGLAREMGEDQPFYAVHPHGLGGSAVPETIEAMAEQLSAAIQRVRPRGPYLVGGHCNGAVIAVEIARRLIAQGERVPLALVIDAKAPWRPTPVFEMGSAPSAPAQPQPRVADPIAPHTMTDERTFLRYRRAMERYAPARLALRIAVLRTTETKDFRPNLGWSSVGQAVEAHFIPGDHLTSITRHVAETAARMRACIDAALLQPADTTRNPS